MKAFVIMGNDYPDAVCFTVDAAGQAVETRKIATVQEAHRNGTPPRIYWRDMEVEVEGPLPHNWNSFFIGWWVGTGVTLLATFVMAVL